MVGSVEGGFMRSLMVMVLLCAACSASNPGPPVPIDEIVEQNNEAGCAHLAKCGQVEDLTACLLVNTFDPLPATLLAGIKAGRIKYDGALARQCFDSIGSRSCDETTASYRGTSEACLAVFQGTLHSGAVCANGAECISGNCEIPACNMACCTGTCQGDDPPRLAKIGESCAINLCEAEADCDSTSMMCVALKSLGETCPVGLSCADGLACLVSSQTCGPLPGPGEPCTDGCRDLGLHCSATTRMCVKDGLLGDPCSSHEDCAYFYVCGANNQCSAGLALGAPCVMSEHCAGSGAFCDIPANATMGTCTAPKPDGASCHTKFECASEVCDPVSKTCVADVPCD